MNPIIQTTFFGYPSTTFWASSTSNMNLRSVTTDKYNNIYVAGNNPTGNIDVHLFNYNYYGSVNWQRTIGSSVGDRSQQIAIDNNNNIYISGDTTDNPSLTYWGVSVKYNSSGSLQWQRRLTGYTGGTRSSGVAVDSSSNQYYCGHTDITSPSNYQSFFYKRNSSGTLQWNRIFGTTASPGGQDFSQKVAIDGNQTNLYILFQTFVGTTRGYISKYNTSGTLQWHRYLSFTVEGLYADNDYFYACGRNASNIAFILKSDPSGNIQWTRTLNVNAFFYGVTVSDNGDVYCVGVNISTSPLTTIVAKYNSSGTIQWQRQISYSGSDFALTEIAVDKIGNIFCCGQRTTSGVQNGTLVKLPTDGSRTGTFGSYTISQSAYTDSSASISFTVDALGDSAASMTDAANTWIDSAGTNNVTFTAL